MACLDTDGEHARLRGVTLDDLYQDALDDEDGDARDKGDEGAGDDADEPVQAASAM